MQNKGMQMMLMEAQKKQRAFEKGMEEIEDTEYEIEKNGIVKVTMLGSYEITSIKIDGEALSPDDADFIEESLKNAINGLVKTIKKDVEELQQKTVGSVKMGF